jgi:hypothetical protein
MIISQDGAEIGCGEIDEGPAEGLKDLNVEWGRGVFGPCGGEITQYSFTEGGTMTDASPTTKLEGLRWQPTWISHMGAVKAGLDYLDIEMSMPWLFGATGHAFMLNIHEQLCPSGWHVLDSPLYEFCGNLGFEVDAFCGHHAVFGPSLEQREDVWNKTRAALDAGLPCYAYDIEIGDYYVIHGYDDTGYFYSGPLCDKGKGPIAWEDLGVKGDVGILMVNAIKPGTAAADTKTVREALAYAVEHARGGDEGNALYVSGLDGYDQWIAALDVVEEGTWGAPYNAACYLEARRNAVAFLNEARDRLPAKFADGFDDAIHQYEQVVEQLQVVSEAFSTGKDAQPGGTYEERAQRAQEALLRAKGAETRGVMALQKLLSSLGDE